MLGCRDVRATAEWFQDTLDFDLNPDGGIFEGVDPDEGAVYALLSGQGAGVHLQIRRGGDPSGVSGDRESIETDAYLYVDGDIDALHDRYVEAGASMYRPLADALAYGMREFTVESPEGHRLTFGAPRGA